MSSEIHPDIVPLRARHITGGKRTASLLLRRALRRRGGAQDLSSKNRACTIHDSGKKRSRARIRPQRAQKARHLVSARSTTAELGERRDARLCSRSESPNGLLSSARILVVGSFFLSFTPPSFANPIKMRSLRLFTNSHIPHLLLPRCVEVRARVPYSI